MQLADISNKFEEKIDDRDELIHLLGLNQVLNVYEHDGIVYIQLAHSEGNGSVVSEAPLEFDRQYNHVAQCIYDRKLRCLTVNDDSYDTENKVSVKELMQMLRSELQG
ncbi:MAG: hypothetical protein K6E90_00390 [Lachnospiraceae bacterium]|nr:hypothetical protein [Lachnospiraceae bacterium]